MFNDQAVGEQSFGISNDEFRVCVFEKNDSETHFGRFLAFANLVRHEIPHCRFYIFKDDMGTGKDDLTYCLNIHGQLTTVGKKQDMNELLKLMDVFVLTGTGSEPEETVVNAMANGCPVIYSSPHGGTNVVENGYNGIVLDTTDPTRLAECVITILDNPLYAAMLSQNARRTVQEYCSRHLGFGKWKAETLSWELD